MSENTNTAVDAVTYEPVTQPGGARLTADECLELLAQTQVGRLIVVLDERPEVFPVNYAMRGNEILVLTAEGGKLAAVAVAPAVAFEIDHADDDVAWSVVVHGKARILSSFSDVEEADKVGLRPWEPTTKHNYVSIPVDEATGRRFVRKAK